jgi:hypothetical protein
MRFTRLIPALAVPMLFVACDQDDPTAPDPPQLQAASIPKLEFPFTWVFPALNPCTGLDHITTITGTVWIQEHPNNRTIRWRGTITTDDGYTGNFVETWTGSNIFGPGGVSNHTMNVIVKRPPDFMYRVSLVWIMDEKPEPDIVRVDLFNLTCLSP